MLAPSLTAMQPFLTSVSASAFTTSFWVADGSATWHGTDQGRWPSWYVAPLKWSTYSCMRPRRTFFRSMTHASFSVSMPLGSWMKPLESDRVTTLPPYSRIFWVQYWATLPEPDTVQVLPAMLSPRAFSISLTKYTYP